ncbi:MAG: TauD/TfdA family dioxygenase [Hydrogenophaga sp.]|uniref:TauD/TfdA dioxygenase family protein n=1 Tax=Hydrogenophaga sp. TaxID=1904254 RepID=UPI001DEB1B2A|nr:TauD/TfdA family dioxygenase [Hydrogenophaga sp.]MBX3611153.1 TauD/TfdA family dioxygenase [Hydrogenophaga sp.]
MGAAAAYLHIRPVPQLPGFAARVDGLDFSAPLSAEVKAELHRALNQFGLLTIEPHTLTPAQHIDLASAFGDIAPGAFFPRLPGHDEVEVIRSDREHPPELNVWHSDVTWRRDFPTGTVIQLIELPESGGNTAWACGRKAFQALSEGMKTYLRGLHATHSWTGSLVEDALRASGEEAMVNAVRRFQPVSHPLVRRHPETGDEVLFANEAFTRRIDGVPMRESRAMLEFLREWMVQPEFVYSHRWRAGALAVWDNRSTQHHAAADYWPQTRLLHRVTFRSQAESAA